MAIASVILGLVWGFGLTSIGAVVFGHVALRQVRRTRQPGHGLAVAGLTLGYVGLAMALLAVVGLMTWTTSSGTSESVTVG